MTIIEEFQSELQLLFSGLNWTYILMYTFVIYGIKNKNEFDWYNELTKMNKWTSMLKEWIAGFVILIFFSFFTYLRDTSHFSSEYVSAILRSFIIVLVFNSVLNKKIKSAEKDLNDQS